MESGFVSLIGAAALLLWSLRMIRTGVSRAFGPQLRRWLSAGTSTRFSAFAVGLSGACALQSSTAIALMTSSFSGRGLVALPMALAILLGADLGTSLVANVLAFDLNWLSPALIAAGVAIFMACRSRVRRATGRALLGTGLLLLSLDLLASATQPFRESPVVEGLLPALAGAPIIGLVIAAVLTVIASSSLATVLLVASLAATADMPATLAIAMVLGANVGGAVVPVVATFAAEPVERRAPLGNLFFRLAASAAVLPFLAPFSDMLVAFGEAPARLVVNAHLAVNLGLSLVFLPFVGAAARALERLLPDETNAENGPKYLDPAFLGTPAMALASAARETMRVGDRIEQMLQLSLAAFSNGDQQACSAIRDMDDEIDTLEEAIKLYVSRLRREGNLGDAEDARAAEILSFAINLEHIGDIIDKNLRDLAEKKIRNQVVFSKEGFSEIREFFERTIENLQTAQSVFMVRDEALARRLFGLKEDIRAFERRSAEAHMERLRQGRVESVETSSLHLDVLRDLKRINAHLTSVAYPMLESTGALRQSRLKKKAGREGEPEQPLSLGAD